MGAVSTSEHEHAVIVVDLRSQASVDSSLGLSPVQGNDLFDRLAHVRLLPWQSSGSLVNAGHALNCRRATLLRH